MTLCNLRDLMHIRPHVKLEEEEEEDYKLGQPTVA